MLVQPRGEGRGPRDVLVDDHEVCRAQAQHGVGACRSGPASADEDNARKVEVDQLVVEADTVMASFLFLESGGQRPLDSGANEAAEQ
jgi:hypothetical protein